MFSPNVALCSPIVPYEGRVTKFDGRIRFSKVTRKDSGEYSCEVSGNSKYGEVKVQLIVLGKAFLKASPLHIFI